MNNKEEKILNDFVDIGDSNNGNFVFIIVILYIMVIILGAILVFIIKHQKETVKDNLELESTNNINDNYKSPESTPSNDNSIDDQVNEPAIEDSNIGTSDPTLPTNSDLDSPQDSINNYNKEENINY